MASKRVRELRSFPRFLERNSAFECTMRLHVVGPLESLFNCLCIGVANGTGVVDFAVL